MITFGGKDFLNILVFLNIGIFISILINSKALEIYTFLIIWLIAFVTVFELLFETYITV